jgi:Tsi6
MKAHLLLYLFIFFTITATCSKEEEPAMASIAPVARAAIIELEQKTEAMKLPQNLEYSIKNQLIFIAELEEGKRTDVGRVKDIILGVQAAREIEDRDAEFAERLHEISYLISKKYGTP